MKRDELVVSIGSSGVNEISHHVLDHKQKMRFLNVTGVHREISFIARSTR